ncbi:UDP-glucuronate:xylan alpha-glucuronosyltransferase 1 [Zea mays]|uniref:UDP-glucuronate:xylan alpha-glucuronosyltransferase 1 n=1 Tax=Zea mays TaxID=4577 RepID=A0A1D6N5K7_MAIZE|nr:UDP-glucuronate:xylan alpha-glucuronosyltransferase 1 [Zea mays]
MRSGATWAVEAWSD